MRRRFEVFNDSNTAYYYGSRGQDHLKGDNLLLIGTPYIPPPVFEHKVEKWFGIPPNSSSTSYVEGWHNYGDPIKQALHELWSSDEQYQMIHRARPLIEDVEILVMGRLPPLIKGEVTIKNRNRSKTLKEKVIERQVDSVLGSYGKEELRKDAIEEGVSIDELGLDSSFDEEVKDEIAQELKAVKYGDGRLSLDGRFDPDNLDI